MARKRSRKCCDDFLTGRIADENLPGGCGLPGPMTGITFSCFCPQTFVTLIGDICTGRCGPTARGCAAVPVPGADRRCRQNGTPWPWQTGVFCWCAENTLACTIMPLVTACQPTVGERREDDEDESGS